MQSLSQGTSEGRLGPARQQHGLRRLAVVSQAASPKKFLRKPAHKGKQARRQQQQQLHQQQQQQRPKEGPEAEHSDEWDLAGPSWTHSTTGSKRPTQHRRLTSLAASRASTQRPSQTLNPWPGLEASDYRDYEGHEDEGGAGQAGVWEGLAGPWEAEEGRGRGEGGILAGLPQQEMDSGEPNWRQAFLTSDRARREGLDKQRRRLFGRGWRQLDVRYYLLRRAAQREAFASLLSESGPQLTTARALQDAAHAAVLPPATSHGGRTGTMSTSQVPLAPIPRPRIPRQRGAGPLDDSLPRPQTLFKLPSPWRRRLLAERVVALRAALPAINPLAAARLYCHAPVMMCLTTRMVVGQLRGLERAMALSINTVAAKISSNPSLGLSNVHRLLATASVIAYRYATAPATPASLLREVITALASHHLLLSMRGDQLHARVELISHALPCSEWAAMRMVLRCPRLVELQPAQLLSRVLETVQLLEQPHVPAAPSTAACTPADIQLSTSSPNDRNKRTRVQSPSVLTGAVPATSVSQHSLGVLRPDQPTAYPHAFGQLPAPWLGLLQRSMAQPRPAVLQVRRAASLLAANPALLAVPTSDLQQVVALLVSHAGLSQGEAFRVLQATPALILQPPNQLASTLATLSALATRYRTSLIDSDGRSPSPMGAAPGHRAMMTLRHAALNAGPLLCVPPGRCKEAAWALEAVVNRDVQGMELLWDHPALQPELQRSTAGSVHSHVRPGQHTRLKRSEPGPLNRVVPLDLKASSPGRGSGGSRGPGKRVLATCLHRAPWLLLPILEALTQQLGDGAGASAGRVPADASQRTFSRRPRRVGLSRGVRLSSPQPASVGQLKQRRYRLPRLPTGSSLTNPCWLHPHPLATSLLDQLLRPWDSHMEHDSPAKTASLHGQTNSATLTAQPRLMTVVQPGPRALSARRQQLLRIARDALAPGLRAAQAAWNLTSPSVTWAVFCLSPTAFASCFHPSGFRELRVRQDLPQAVSGGPAAQGVQGDAVSGHDEHSRGLDELAHWAHLLMDVEATVLQERAGRQGHHSGSGSEQQAFSMQTEQQVVMQESADSQRQVEQLDLANQPNMPQQAFPRQAEKQAPVAQAAQATRPSQTQHQRIIRQEETSALARRPGQVQQQQGFGRRPMPAARHRATQMAEEGVWQHGSAAGRSAVPGVARPAPAEKLPPQGVRPPGSRSPVEGARQVPIAGDAHSTAPAPMQVPVDRLRSRAAAQGVGQMQPVRRGLEGPDYDAMPEDGDGLQDHEIDQAWVVPGVRGQQQAPRRPPGSGNKVHTADARGGNKAPVDAHAQPTGQEPELAQSMRDTRDTARTLPNAQSSTAPSQPNTSEPAAQGQGRAPSARRARGYVRRPASGDQAS